MSGEVIKGSNHPSLPVKKKPPHRFHKRKSSWAPQLDPSFEQKFFAEEESVMRRKPRPRLFTQRGRKLFPVPTPSTPELRPCLPFPYRLWPAATDTATCSIIAELRRDTLQFLTFTTPISGFCRLIAAITVLQLHLIKIMHVGKIAPCQLWSSARTLYLTLTGGYFLF